jgi:PadR family transcriptional regulator PadR
MPTSRHIFRPMPSSNHAGDLEQMVLLAVLRLDNAAYALDVLSELHARAGRRVTRGTLYKTLDRLESKGLLGWEVEEAGPERGGHPRRLFRVTPAGVRVLRASRSALFRMWEGLDATLGRTRRASRVDPMIALRTE